MICTHDCFHREGKHNAAKLTSSPVVVRITVPLQRAHRSAKPGRPARSLFAGDHGRGRTGVGKLKGTPTSETLGHGVRCGYDFADEKNEFEIWASEASWSKALHKDAKQPVMVSGLGDEAFMDRGKVDPEAVDLYIRKGATLIVLMTRKSPGDEEKLKTLGKKALGRL